MTTYNFTPQEALFIGEIITELKVRQQMKLIMLQEESEWLGRIVKSSWNTLWWILLFLVSNFFFVRYIHGNPFILLGLLLCMRIIIYTIQARKNTVARTQSDACTQTQQLLKDVSVIFEKHHVEKDRLWKKILDEKIESSNCTYLRSIRACLNYLTRVEETGKNFLTRRGT